MPVLAQAALDLGQARWGISRDLGELAAGGLLGWVIIVASGALPLAAILALIKRRWIALLPLGISLGLLALWALYYATDWWSDPGQGAWAPAFGLVLLGWLALIGTIWPPQHLGDPTRTDASSNTRV